MSELPSGTITFLFTDIEGSTKLLHELGTQAFAEALSEHRRVIRDACVRHDGVEVDTQGDAFFLAFATPHGALGAARAIADGLASGPIRVRMGVHTGTPLLTEEGYVGADVHRAARIAAAGHGGQVLVSSATAALVGAGDAPLRDLGEHRLKDLSAAERVHQLGDGEFPSLKTLYRTNLPVPATPFHGRERELRDVVEQLLRDDLRLLTLTGPGGTGKTRLALQAAAEAAESFPDGITWVPLAPLREPALLLPTVAQTLEIRDEPGRQLDELLVSALSGKRTLLLLDNAEHLLPGAAAHVALLAPVAGLVLLVTSRERLQVQSEQLYPVPALEERDGVELFLARARALDPLFASNGDVAELCVRLDNLPLALELAAARTVVFSPAQLLDRLGQRLDLLKGGRDADPRQQTLRATIEWSYDLLDSEEQRLFRALSVFAGGCTYEAAESVGGADPDTLQSLLDKSLLRRRDSDLGPRYWMLETIGEYAAERAAELGEHEPMRDRHLSRFAEETYARSRAARDFQPEARAFLRLEQPNLREALTWCLATGRAEPAQRVLAGAWFYWLIGGLASEGDEWATKVVALPSPATELYGWSLVVAGEFPRFRGDPHRALSLKERAVAIFEQLDPEDRSVRSHLAATHSDLSDVLGQIGDLDRAAEHAEHALAIRRELGLPGGIAHALSGVALVAERRGDLERAASLYEESYALLHEIGKPLEAAADLVYLGNVRRRLGDLDAAREALEEALRRADEAGDLFTRADARAGLGLLAVDEGALEEAVVLLSQATAASRDIGIVLDYAADVDAAIADCRTRLPDELFEAAWARGATADADPPARTRGQSRY